MVAIHVTAQIANPIRPWLRFPPITRDGFGVIIAPGRILTAERLVRNQLLVEVSKAQGGIKTIVSVVEADQQTGAAILAWSNAPALSGLIPTALPPDNPSLPAEVVIAQFDQTEAIQSDHATITEAMLMPLPEAAGNMLLYRALTSLNTGQCGAPVFYQNYLAGIILHTSRESQTAWILPAHVIRRFWQDVAHPPYQGIAYAGFGWTALIDPVKRACLGADPDIAAGGIEVTHTIAGTDAAKMLQPGDIITKWDGASLDAQGYYADQDFGRLLFPFLITGRCRPGDTSRLSILRQGQPYELEINLSRHTDAQKQIPDNLGINQPDYLIECGLVFRELGLDYLQAAGEAWITYANPRLVYRYFSQAQTQSEKNKRTVVLAGVLPDVINIGYQNLHDEIVEAVNGENISCLKDMIRILDRDKGIQRLSLEGWGQNIILDIKTRNAANQRLTQTYRLPALRKINLRD